MKENNEKKVVKQQDVFTKESIVKSKKYSNRKDLLNALLDDKKSYSFEQVDEIIDKFMKGEVK